MTKDEILEKKLHGDLKTAGAMIGISDKNAYAALSREGSKHHKQIVEILTRIISMREQIQKETNHETATL